MVNQSVEDITVAAGLYGQALALDPKFALAHARLSLMNSYLARQSSSDPALKIKARAEAEEALRLSPWLGAAHLARGLCLYWSDRDYAPALKEFLLDAETAPNEPYLYYFISGIYSAQGRWREALATMQRAQERDPRNRDVFLRAGDSHLFVRDWAGATECFQRGLKIAPDSADATISLAYIAVFRDKNPAAGEKLLQTLPAGIDPDGIVTEARWDMAMLERDWAGAEKILANSPAPGFPRSGKGAKEFLAGRTALASGDGASARRFFALAAPGFEEWVREDPTDASRHARLGLLYAYMQRNEDSLRESLRAVEMEPASRDALRAARAQANLALVYALLNKRGQALNLVESLLSTPGPLDWPNFPPSITLSDLRLRWEWDALRNDSRFQKIIVSAEPKTILTNVAPPAPLAPEKSIAVLPFENLSGKQQNAYFAKGIQDDILTSLAKIHELRVISRTSVMSCQKPGSRNVREIGRALGVENVLEGSVRREGDRVLLNVQLIDARSDRHLWAERYDRTGADAIGLQGELASEIAASLQAKLAPEEEERLAKQPTANPEAYTLYLRGLGWERVVNPSNESRTAAEQLYAQAIALDPKFALAHARLSIVESRLTYESDGPNPGAKARRAAEEALRLSPSLGEGHMALGLCFYWADKNYPAALKEFSIAAATLPNEPDILNYIAGVY
ncbi:MAG: tetratricopeptide repeat protein, partial [Chthoniobacterales bacterium]